MNLPSTKIFLSIVLLLLISSYVYSQNVSKMTFLSGSLKNFGKRIQVEDMSELKDLKLQDSLRILKTDSIGNFSLSFELTKPNYYRIGRNILYLSPGDILFMHIDYNNPDSSTFKGNNSEANEYLRSTPFPKAGSFLEAGHSIKLTLSETINTILLAAKKRGKILDNYKHLTAKFRLLEKARIKADIINSLLYIDFYFPYIHKLSEDSALLFRKNSKKVIEPYLIYYYKNFTNQDFLKLVVYRDIISKILKQNNSKSNNATAILEWINARTLLQKIERLDKFEDNSKLAQEIANIKQEGYQLALLSAFNKVKEFNIGDSAIDFDMSDVNGEVVSLKKYKGKIIFIDLWATWCLPCLDEFPFLDTIQQYYKDDSILVFISLSIDNNNAAWKKYLTEHGKMNGTQYIIDRLKLTAYSVNEIPRTIIISKDYKIAMLNAPLPSSKEIKNIIDSLLLKE